MNNTTDVGYFIFTIILVGCSLTALVLYLLYKHRVKSKSTRLKTLNEINTQYIFHTDIWSLTYNVSTETKRQFDRFDFNGYLQAVIKENKAQYTDMIDKCEENLEKYSDYISKIQLISIGSISKDAKRCGLGVSLYKIIEDKLMKSSTQNPLRNFSVECRLSYISPKGRNHYFKSHIFTYDDIKNAFKNAERQIVTKEGIAYERALVTDSMRYDILRRDGFRCQICGASQKDGVTLHVDHIVPVSKGGRSVPSNLRTLCERCNMGKSNKYDPNGLN